MLVAETRALSSMKCLFNVEKILSMLHLQQIQAQFIKIGLDRYTSAIDKLLAFSAISDKGDLNYGSSIFTHIENPTKFMWNMIIRGFSKSNEPQRTFLWYSRMINSGILPDKFTYPFVLKACSRLLDLEKGQQVHSQIIKTGPSMDSHIDSSLVFLYTSCGDLGKGRIVFEGIQYRNLVSWNVMISGCVRSGKFVQEAVEAFKQMRSHCLESVDKFSLVSVTSACANMGALALGKWVHGLVCKTGFSHVVPLGNALVDMYGKCGSLDDACKFFDEMTLRNIVSWSTIIDVYAIHGQRKLAVNKFIQMESQGIAPDDMVFTSLLCACNHSGSFQEGKMWFDKMRFKYRITPKIQHYGCMVDLLGKAGLLQEAYELIRDMPIDPDAAIWNSLVAASLYQSDLDMAETAITPLRTLTPDDPGEVIIMSNVNARLGRWNNVETLRRRARKSPGYSFVEVNNVVHRFVSMDTSHPQTYEIYFLINQMKGNLQQQGFL